MFGKKKKKQVFGQHITGTQIQCMKDPFAQSSQSNRAIGLLDLHPLRVLGKGGFGSALLVEHEQYGLRLVLKVVKKDRVRKDTLGPATEREVRLCHPLRHMQTPRLAGFELLAAK